MTAKLSRKAKKLPQRRCSACAKQFQPRRKDQRACSPKCRYAKFASEVQRVRLKSFTLDKLPCWHYVQVSNSVSPCALFANRADAEAFARYLRRKQRKEQPAARARVSVGITFAPATPDLDKNPTGKRKAKTPTQADKRLRLKPESPTSENFAPNYQVGTATPNDCFLTRNAG